MCLFLFLFFSNSERKEMLRRSHVVTLCSVFTTGHAACCLSRNTEILLCD